MSTYRRVIQTPQAQAWLSSAGALLQEHCHGVAKEAGWWAGQQPAEARREILKHIRSKLELLALEAQIAPCTNKEAMDLILPHRTMTEGGLAEVIINILDLAGGLNLDVSGALVEKLIYETQRPAPNPENRIANGGKAC